MPSDTTTLTVPTALVDRYRANLAEYDAAVALADAILAAPAPAAAEPATIPMLHGESLHIEPDGEHTRLRVRGYGYERVFYADAAASAQIVAALSGRTPTPAAADERSDGLLVADLRIAAGQAATCPHDDDGECEHGRAVDEAMARLLSTLATLRSERDAARSALAEVAHQLQPAEGENVVDAATRRAAQALTYADQAKALRSALADAERDYLAVAQAAGIVYQADGHADEPGSVEEIVERIRELQVTETEWMEARYFGFSADGTCRACSGEGYHDVGEDRTVECDECKGHGVLPRLLAARFLLAGWKRLATEMMRAALTKDDALTRATERGERMARAIRGYAWAAATDAAAAWDARDAAGGETESK